MRDGGWGDHFTLLAAAAVLKRAIIPASISRGTGQLSCDPITVPKEWGIEMNNEEPLVLGVIAESHFFAAVNIRGRGSSAEGSSSHHRSANTRGAPRKEARKDAEPDRGEPSEGKDKSNLQAVGPSISVEQIPGSNCANVGQNPTPEDAGSHPLVTNEDEEWRIASWNCTGLSDIKVERISKIGGAMWMIQETHLAQLQLEQRKRDAQRLGWKLIHGKAVPADKMRGRVRGVGALMAPGVTAREVMPPGRAWKKLWEAQRVQMIEFVPRNGLPRGLRIVNVYAPVVWSASECGEGDIEKTWFQELFIEAVSCLDLGIPTLFMGDWNGTVHPERDYAAERLPMKANCCPLLTWLLGP